MAEHGISRCLRRDAILDPRPEIIGGQELLTLRAGLGIKERAIAGVEPLQVELNLRPARVKGKTQWKALTLKAVLTLSTALILLAATAQLTMLTLTHRNVVLRSETK